ncbi:hypothetical protein RyT2_24980 [Pseudolactococcus yaeyamensis]
MKKKIIVLLFLSIICLSGCANSSLNALNTRFNYVQIKLQNGQVINGEIKELNVSNETVSVILNDGSAYGGSVKDFSFSTQKFK